MRTLLTLLQRVLSKGDVYPLADDQREQVSGVEKRLAGIVARGCITSEERSWLVWTARLLLVTVFQPKN